MKKTRSDITGTASHDGIEFVIYGRVNHETREHRWDIIATELGVALARTSRFVTHTTGYKSLANNEVFLAYLANLTRMGVSKAVEYT